MQQLTFIARPYKNKGAPIAAPRAHKAEPTDWQPELISHIDALKQRLLSSLSIEERYDLARYHALRWANCTKSELKNRQGASRIAAGIANFAEHCERRDGLKDFTVGEYCFHARRLWVRRGEFPLFRVWDIIADIEFET